MIRSPSSSAINRLLLVDPICHSRAPTMRAWLNAAQHVLPKHFEEVEIWSMECELDLPWVKFRRFPKISGFWPIQCGAFRLAAWRAYGKLSDKEKSRTFIQCTGEHLPIADSRYIHFWNISYAETQKSKPLEMDVPLKDRIMRKITIGAELECLKPGATREWWCVSRGIAAPIAAASPPDSVFRYLPNSFDPTRFNSTKRNDFRESARKLYGFSQDEIVFVFCSFGHFVRKGLLQAVEAVQQLREESLPVRFLVLGGSLDTIADFKDRMKKRSISEEGVIFAGQVAPPEEHLAAADALLFPSHFEAFSLVEIEAAALGLRLYLTAHPGNEMILRPGINGQLLPWDVTEMTNVLRHDISTGEVAKTHSEIGDALTPSEYAKQLSKLYEEGIKRKDDGIY